MKFATFKNSSGAATVGIVDVEGGRVLGLQQAAEVLGKRREPEFDSLLSLIDSGDAGLDKARSAAERWPEEASHSLADVTLLAPLPEPRSIRDCLVFEQHLKNVLDQQSRKWGLKDARIPPAWYERPSYYKGNRFSVIGTGQDVVWPHYSKDMDFELELACVIGRKGADIRPEDALSHIFGFTIFNDFSARDVQAVEKTLNMGSSKAKDFDTGNAIGPWIVTTDEIGDPHALAMEVRINGERWGGGNSRDMYHDFSDIVSFISTCETLHPGEVIGSGTVGTGCGLEFGRMLQANDVVELEIEKIGVLRNRVTRR